MKINILKEEIEGKLKNDLNKKLKQKSIDDFNNLTTSFNFG